MTKQSKDRLIRLRTAASGPDFSLAPGDLISLSAERAAELVDGHYADYVDAAEVAEIAPVADVVTEVTPEAEEPKAEPEPEVAPGPVAPEAAAFETAEIAVVPAARGRRRGAARSESES